MQSNDDLASVSDEAARVDIFDDVQVFDAQRE